MASLKARQVELFSGRRVGPGGLVLTLGIVLATALTARGQVPRPGSMVYPDFSSTAQSLLRSAADHARDGHWTEAIGLYQRVGDEYGGTVVKLPEGDPAVDPTGESVLYINARLFCQRRLAALPPEARERYRARVDAQAERWYRQGAERRDRGLLRRVVDEAFCSSWGDDALELLGDLAFQDGRLAEALAAYRRLAPEPGAAEMGLAHPDPSIDLARVAAKALLCRAAQGEDPPSPEDLKALAAAHPDASGALAGRRGPLVESLAEALARDDLAPPPGLEDLWPTFAGSPTRTRIAPGPVDVGSFQWKVPLEPQTPPSRHQYRPIRIGGVFPPQAVSPASPEQLLAYHPIIVGDQVLVGNEQQVVAYRLDERPADPGASAGSAIPEAWKHDERRNTFGTPTAVRMFTSVPRFTLTAQGDRVFARLGPPGPMLTRGPNSMGAAPSVIVALDRKAEGKLLWKRSADQIDLPQRPGDGGPNRFAGFEGTPVADAHSVYVALTEGTPMTKTYVACLDAETGATRWVRYVCDATPAVDMGMGILLGLDLSHRLLTLDGATVYYQTNLGALAAIDAETGAMRWVATYPRQDRNGAPGRRDLNPAIVHDGRVFIAPDDADRIYAFDAASGRLLWKSDPLPEVAHLLGVARGRLVATGDHVWRLDAATGRVQTVWPDNGKFEGYGRGLLAGDSIYWPTRGEIHVLDQATGLRPGPPLKLREAFGTDGGNLAVGDGYLVVAQADALVVFCQNSRLIQRYRQEIVRAPDRADGYFRLGRVAEAVGQDELALTSLERAVALAHPSERIDGQPLVEVARDHRYRLLMRLGEKATDDQDWDGAAARYDEAARAARPGRDRLTARLRLADVQLAQARPREAVATLQALLADADLRSLVVAADEHRPPRRTVRADLMIADRLATLLRERGRDLYAPFEVEARALLERGRTGQDARLLAEVVHAYPVAEAVPDALVALGELAESGGHPDEASRAYKRLLATAPDDAYRARALWGLGQAYEAQNLWVPARDTYARALARFADQDLGRFGLPARLGTLVQDRLAREPLVRMSGERGEPGLPLPLGRSWTRRWAGSARPLEAAGVPPSADAASLLVAQGTRLQPIDPQTGAFAWSADLGGPPAWAGYLSDRLLAATPTRLVALDLARGAVAWQYDLDPNRPAGAGANPFAPAPDRAGGDDAAAESLHGFRIEGGRVFCLRGERALLAFDGDTGLIDWSFAPASGRINPHLAVGPERVVLQVRGPGALVVLETATGRVLAEHARPPEEDWARDPLPLDDDRLVLALDARTVALFDLARGALGWSFRESPLLPRYGPPRLLGDAGRLLVLHDGNRLIRLDPATGGKLWERPLGVEDLSDRPEALALDGNRLYWVGGQALGGVRTAALLEAIDLADGATAWRRHLTGPETGWALDLVAGCVATYPDPSRAAEGGLDGLPLVLCRRDSGALVQRVLLRAPVADLAVRLAPRGALVATQGGLWALGGRVMDERPPRDTADSLAGGEAKSPP